jgi:small subunit ribosomal protein S20
MNTAVKKVRSAKGKDEAAAALAKINKLLDQLAAKGIIHKNNAANKKSRLTKFVNAMK